MMDNQRPAVNATTFKQPGSVEIKGSTANQLQILNHFLNILLCSMNEVQMRNRSN